MAGLSELIEMKCKCCGGREFAYDEKSHFAICKYCKSTYLFEQIDEHSSAKKLDNAELCLVKFNEPNKAREYFNDAVELDQSNFRAWWGLARVETGNFKNIMIPEFTLNKVKEFVHKAVLVAPEPLVDFMNEVKSAYVKKVTQYHQLKNDVNNNDGLIGIYLFGLFCSSIGVYLSVIVFLNYLNNLIDDHFNNLFEGDKIIFIVSAITAIVFLVIDIVILKAIIKRKRKLSSLKRELESVIADNDCSAGKSELS